MTHEFHRRHVAPPSQWPQLAFTALWGLGFGSAVFMVPVLGLLFGVIGFSATGGVLYTLWRHYRGQRYGVRLDERGLTDCRWLLTDRHVPWDRVRDVNVGERQVTVETADGPLVIDAGVHAWQRLGRAIERYLGRGDDPGAPTVDPRELEGWLGLDPGGRLECRPRSDYRAWVLLLVPVWAVVTAGLVALYRPFFLGALHSHGAVQVGSLVFTAAHASIFFGAFSGGLLKVILLGLRPPHSVRADASGVSVRHPLGWQQYRWDEVLGMPRQRHVYGLNLGDEQVNIPDTWLNAAPLARAVEQAVEARRDGWRLPADGPISGAALSLAPHGGTEADERALSRGVPGVGAGDSAL